MVDNMVDNTYIIIYMRTLPGKFVTGKTGDAESYLNPFDIYLFFQQSRFSGKWPPLKTCNSSSKARMFVLPWLWEERVYWSRSKRQTLENELLETNINLQFQVTSKHPRFLLHGELWFHCLRTKQQIWIIFQKHPRRTQHQLTT